MQSAVPLDKKKCSYTKYKYTNKLSGEPKKKT